MAAVSIRRRCATDKINVENAAQKPHRAALSLRYTHEPLVKLYFTVTAYIFSLPDYLKCDTEMDVSALPYLLSSLTQEGETISRLAR